MVSKTYKEILTNVSNTSVLFEKLGITINYKKSPVTPNTKIEHLGFIIDSEKMTVSLTLEKVGKLSTLCETIINKEGVIIIQFLSQILSISNLA